MAMRSIKPKRRYAVLKVNGDGSWKIVDNGSSFMSPILGCIVFALLLTGGFIVLNALFPPPSRAMAIRTWGSLWLVVAALCVVGVYGWLIAYNKFESLPGDQNHFLFIHGRLLMRRRGQVAREHCHIRIRESSSLQSPENHVVQFMPGFLAPLALFEGGLNECQHFVRELPDDLQSLVWGSSGKERNQING